MIILELLVIAFAVGIATKTWLGFLGTLFGLYALYRFTRLAAVLAFALTLYWGLIGYHVGAATGEPLVGPLLAIVGFVVGTIVHADGFERLVPVLRGRLEPHLAGPSIEPARTPGTPGYEPLPDDDEAEVIDVEFRVIS